MGKGGSQETRYSNSLRGWGGATEPVVLLAYNSASSFGVPNFSRPHHWIVSEYPGMMVRGVFAQPTFKGGTPIDLTLGKLFE